MAPRLGLRCVGVRSPQRSASPSESGRVFFSESQYARSPFLVRVSFDSVAFVHRGTNVVERRFIFPTRILHAVLADFSAHVLSNTNTTRCGGSAPKRARDSPLHPRTHPHLCVLVRSDCVNVYTATGEVFEVALPFQANRLFPMEGRGLLLQRSPAAQVPSTSSKRPRDAAAAALARKNRRASTSNRGDGDRYKYSSGDRGAPSRPRYFTLRHPLDEVKPVALKDVTRSDEKFLADLALEAVNVLEDGATPVLVAFHRWEQRFCVFRMSEVGRSGGDQLMPKVRVVDGPTWTKYRARTDLEELRVRIEPDWWAIPVWKSPRVGPATSNPMFLSPIVSPPAASSAPPSPLTTTSAGNDSKVAFIASGIDGSPLLCVLDKGCGTLLLKPLSQQESSTAMLDEADGEAGGVRIVRCRDAVPIFQQNNANSFEAGECSTNGEYVTSSIDIVVLEKDSTLMLYRAHRPICHLDVPAAEQDGSDGSTAEDETSAKIRLMGIAQLHSIDRGYAYELVFPDVCGSNSGKIWRCEHPLKVVGSPLLQQVFAVLDCIIPPTDMCSFKAQVLHRAQHKMRTTMEDDQPGSEWQSFKDCIFDMLARRAESKSVVGATDEYKEMLAAATSSISSFDALCQSEFHGLYQYEHAMLFATMEIPGVESTTDKFSKRMDNNRIHEYPVIEKYWETMFAGLHLLCEDLKLSITLLKQRLQLVDLLLEMSSRLRLNSFADYYKQDNCVLQRQLGTEVQSKEPGEDLLCFTSYGCVPDLVLWLQHKITARSQGVVTFPLLEEVLSQSSSDRPSPVRCANPLRRTRAICHAYELLFPGTEETFQTSAFNLIVYLTQDSIGSLLSLDDLPVGLHFPIVQGIRYVKHHPPPFITEDVCAFVGREDLSIASAENLSDHVDHSAFTQIQQHQDSRSKAVDLTENDSHDDCDGLEDIISRSQPLFPHDQRMKEVARLLRSSRAICLKLEKTPDLSDLDYAQQQQARLLLLCKRSMALSVARGMVTLGSFDVSAAQTQIWRLSIPALPLAGRKPPANAIVELDLSGYAKELTYWPQFHNGCATGLRLPAHDLSSVINRHWIKYHRPSVNDAPQRNSAGNRQASAAQSVDSTGRSLDEAYAAHAGLLLGIGLRGHLKCLSMADVYNYLSLSNEFVTVAIMLGMASTAAHCRRKRKEKTATVKPNTGAGEQDAEMPALDADHLFSSLPELSSSDRTPLLGTGLELALERSVSKMLCLHVPSLLPSPFGGFSVPASTQTAALLGLGILYQGTGYRLMTELLLTEIARSPSSAQFVGNNGNAGLSTASFDQHEGYALAAGMALGLVVLGRGQTTAGDPGLADLKLEEKLHKYIVGGAQQYRDANAAGSCLYRGRRWHAFGSGGNGFNSAVNGNSTGNGTPNSNTGASPGAGRDTKHVNDRSGARGGGEHVNVGVTACASALALAFMYMQTDNKAVAAQLVVPDTLILLDYVRPDILLVRTLAKNLVMWNSISPTLQWIDQHEIPAQLLQAYKAIQPRTSDAKGQVENHSASPMHSDLHSICEAYANIVAGACMSIGLRFAGTGNMTARATLRKYVLHFRELRTKSSSSSSMLLRGSSNVVAAATERATVERCLALCAQALALVDAGTGNVETLTLLRSVSLRQRVDATMSYGNHMTLSMAIGLLFLGGGRATISRSKEAIAALVISLYPMPPMNTADNKYHLQAFRHLYVLAVDNSRLLETVDVNTKTTCPVELRIDLHPATLLSTGESQATSIVLQSPCLLPDMSTIKRLVISDSKFYPVEILTVPSSEEQTSSKNVNMRTANALRLELLQSKNLVFLKRRQRKDVGVFRGLYNGLREGSSSDDDRIQSIFRAYFTASHDADDVDDGEDEDVIDWGNSWWASQLNPRALKHVREEEKLLLPPYLNVLHALFRLQQVPQLACATEVNTLSLFSEYCRLPAPLPPTTGKLESVGRSGILEKNAAFSDFGVWLSNQTEEALAALWHRSSLSITSLASARNQLLVGGSIPAKAQSSADDFFVSVLVRYFAGPSVGSLPVADQHHDGDKDWKSKFQRVLAACSQTQSQSTSAFRLSAFLEQEELTEAEKTFWLKLVSFFLFSN